MLTGDFAVFTNKKGTTIAVSYSDCAWNLKSTYTQVILKMMQVLVLKYDIDLYTSIYGMFQKFLKPNEAYLFQMQ